MTNQYIEFQKQVEAVKARHTSGEIDEEQRDNLLRQMQLLDDTWGDVWMLSPRDEWFRKAKGSKSWVRDYPLPLVEGDTLPTIAEMNQPQLNKAIHDCTRCPLHEERKRAVPGEGPVPADIMMIGEGPGFHEDKQARPFVGASGRLLETLLGNLGYQRHDVFIANVVKCRPPNNRDPKTKELSTCKPFLDRQVELVDPKVIVTLGRFSMYRYFPKASITKIHGQPKRVDNRLVVPMFHPAAALRNPKWMDWMTEDFDRLPELVEEARGF